MFTTDSSFRFRFQPPQSAPSDPADPASDAGIADPRTCRKRSYEQKRHLAHQAHTGLDLAKLAKEAPTLVGEINHILMKNKHVSPATAESMVTLAEEAPDLAQTVFSTIDKHPRLGRPMLNAVPKLVQVNQQVLNNLKKGYPQLSEETLSKITAKSIARSLGEALPIVGVGLAAWGSVDTVAAMFDPRLSGTTKGLYAAANSADWGAAVGGLFAETGIGEAAAIGSAVVSIGLYAKAEASKEVDLEAKDHAPEQASAPPDDAPPQPTAFSILQQAG